jgi:hypothetical protein
MEDKKRFQELLGCLLSVKADRILGDVIGGDIVCDVKKVVLCLVKPSLISRIRLAHRAPYPPFQSLKARCLSASLVAELLLVCTPQYPMAMGVARRWK